MLGVIGGKSVQPIGHLLHGRHAFKRSKARFPRLITMVPGMCRDRTKTSHSGNNRSILLAPFLSNSYALFQSTYTEMSKGRFHYYPILGKDTKNNYISSLQN